MPSGRGRYVPTGACFGKGYEATFEDFMTVKTRLLPRKRAQQTPLARTCAKAQPYGQESYCLSMISGQTLRVCPEGKPVPTFPDHALRKRHGPAPEKPRAARPG